MFDANSRNWRKLRDVLEKEGSSEGITPPYINVREKSPYILSTLSKIRSARHRPLWQVRVITPDPLCHKEKVDSNRCRGLAVQQSQWEPLAFR
jgi:hypothetical protein